MLTDPSPMEFQVSVITTFLFLIALLGSLSIVISAPFLIRLFNKSLEGDKCLGVHIVSFKSVIVEASNQLCITLFPSPIHIIFCSDKNPLFSSIVKMSAIT